MPVTLVQLASNRAPAVIDFGGGSVLNVEFYPQRLTAHMLAESPQISNMQGLSNDRALAVMDGLTDTLLTILASWDLVDSIAADGTPGATVPLDRDHVAEMGLGVQYAIMNGIVASGQKPGESSAPGASGSVNEQPSGAISSATAA